MPFLIATLILIYTSTAAAYQDRPIINDYSELETNERSEFHSDKECKPNDTACKVNRKVHRIEKTIEGEADQYETGEVWDKLQVPEEHHGKTKYGLRALKLAAQTPDYLLRGVTWPLAVSAKYLIKKGVVEDMVNFFSNDARTFWVYPLIEIGFGDSLGLGIGIRHTDLFHKNYKFSLKHQIHINLDQSSNIKFGKPDAVMINGRPLSYEISTKWRRYYAGNYYGMGIGTPQSDHSIFGIDTIRWGGEVKYNLISHLNIAGNLYANNDMSKNGEDGYPNVATTFPLSELPGFKKFIFYLTPGIRLEYDNRNHTAAPSKGGHHFFKFKRFQGLNRTDFDFNEYEVQALQFFELWNNRHVLALRMNWKFRHETNGSQIPFYRETSLDVYSPIRGFSSGRFHDRIRSVYNVEYRFKVWSFVDGQLFFDTGRVYHNAKDISFKKFKYAGGVGLRLRTNNYFLLRTQVAYGGEGVKFLVKTSQAF
ncbi:MAG: hypothetical protein HN337_05995 [Deltaproteobacteria bacterium]|jgi:hypothetical protein|nr:hypothetical protein [Deltaproteobacteria bacterium]